MENANENERADRQERERKDEGEHSTERERKEEGGAQQSERKEESERYERERKGSYPDPHATADQPAGGDRGLHDLHPRLPERASDPVGAINSTKGQHRGPGTRSSGVKRPRPFGDLDQSLHLR